MKPLRVFSLLTFAFIAIGCSPSGPDIASVKGTVTMDGKPLEYATVIFIPTSGGRPAVARTDKEGQYELRFSGGRMGTIPGLNKVRITTVRDPGEDEDGNPIPGSKETIPMEYNQTSKLEFTVEDGKENVADFQLESGGKILSGNDGY
ncbi:MAG: carboxypeptidase regulatory-like domain-containing protein [Planctomycetales bacterium]|nr:carboxypeptidase regulatory-like domain-containing protein [Planctomycetales bacterium]